MPRATDPTARLRKQNVGDGRRENRADREHREEVCHIRQRTHCKHTYVRVCACLRVCVCVCVCAPEIVRTRARAKCLRMSECARAVGDSMEHPRALRSSRLGSTAVRCPRTSPQMPATHCIASHREPLERNASQREPFLSPCPNAARTEVRTCADHVAAEHNAQ